MSIVNEVSCGKCGSFLTFQVSFNSKSEDIDVSVDPCKSCLAEAEKTGDEAGYEAGIDKGKDLGYETAYREGFEDGFEKGFAQGFEKGDLQECVDTKEFEKIKIKEVG